MNATMRGSIPFVRGAQGFEIELPLIGKHDQRYRSRAVEKSGGQGTRDPPVPIGEGMDVHQRVMSVGGLQRRMCLLERIRADLGDEATHLLPHALGGRKGKDSPGCEAHVVRPRLVLALPELMVLPASSASLRPGQSAKAGNSR
jgi:hypothetical protein